MKLLYSFLCVAVVTVFVEAKITHSELAENKAKGLRLMSLENGVDPIWKTEEERLDLVRGHINFFDITEVFDPDAPIGSERKTANHPPYRPPTHQSEVKAIIANLSLPNIKSHVNHLTQYNNRYPTDETGAQASKWILKTVQDIIAKYPKRGATVKPFHHPGWNQTSVIARIPGSIESAVTIVGAHLDSFNHEFTFGRAPGADYDATGCASLLETFRALLASGFKPTKPVEFHWYSAQNIGNVGSLAVAQSYKKAGTEVKAMMNVDGTAYVKPMTTPVFGITDTDAGLTDFLRLVIDNYSNTTYAESSECGYACSDHASWSKYGYPTCMPIEGRWSDINPYRGTSSDTTSVRGFSWDHAFEFTKVIVGFAYELGVARSLTL